MAWLKQLEDQKVIERSRVGVVQEYRLRPRAGGLKLPERAVTTAERKSGSWRTDLCNSMLKSRTGSWKTKTAAAALAATCVVCGDRDGRIHIQRKKLMTLLEYTDINQLDATLKALEERNLFAKQKVWRSIKVWPTVRPEEPKRPAPKTGPANRSSAPRWNERNGRPARRHEEEPRERYQLSEKQLGKLCALTRALGHEPDEERYRKLDNVQAWKSIQQLERKAKEVGATSAGRSEPEESPETGSAPCHESEEQAGPGEDTRPVGEKRNINVEPTEEESEESKKRAEEKMKSLGLRKNTEGYWIRTWSPPPWRGGL